MVYESETEGGKEFGTASLIVLYAVLIGRYL